ncbi:DUF6431 domain-containing protein [Methylomusa anaerophila]|uniref:DUF6431 domain-containing protein n=1 Tax=Methylomusa anaerophila TaxID=1930071 RepID=A0A348AEA9_9FIRM|nr:MULTISPECIES: DUF6431 domain-containing protein [Bacteria]BBB89407.1 hypothetical protein MAMMFC1_00040 [Methylomusa anaerophila]BBB90452.1 hypothetical protein MAMMFC1_01103 [Methylomusa anaerophila]BBB92241.1 hypothetical protein MAMMFC1_02926 [Methylomusa anaerophila]BBB92399.1 hypothetical protein MAMMFC1_03092 [Methylomusa anaerophila]BBB93364.1 hypothetical protein MAMMFC1_04076 [Methylomusa anaerophila]
MQILITVKETITQYITRFQALEIVRPEKCPVCGAVHSIHRHGSYWRNILNEQWEKRIPVARFYCKTCKLTISMLPSFALPYFQYSLEFIVTALQQIFLAKATTSRICSALLRFYRRRFHGNLLFLEMFFRDQGWPEVTPQDVKEKATKMVCMLTVPTAETLSQRFHQHYKHTFMAHSLYHRFYLSVNQCVPT